MKKIAVFAIVIILVACGAITGILPRQDECARFWTHADKHVDPGKLAAMLTALEGGGLQYSAWTNGAGIMRIAFTYQGTRYFATWGTGNPTLFDPASGEDYIRAQTRGWKQITSAAELARLRGSFKCFLKAQPQPVTVTVTVPKAQPAPVPATALVGLAIGTFILLGIGKLALSRA